MRNTGCIVVTVPNSYPYHPDPIDTYYRPTPKQVADLFDGFELTEYQILEDTTYLQDLIKEKTAGELVHHIVVHGAKLFWPFSDFSAWRARYHERGLLRKQYAG